MCVFQTQDRQRPLFLASKSPRRRQLLEQLGLIFQTLEIDIVEMPVQAEPAEAYVCRLAREKAAAGLRLVATVPGAVVIGSDTEVVLEGEIFGKPEDAEAARNMLRRLSGREHQVLTAVAVVSAAHEFESMQTSRVRIAALKAHDIDAYVATGEPFGKAGAYAIQGRAAAFISHLSGSHSCVMGLPLHETALLLREMSAALAAP